ncbi:hypothetical protein [Gilliamella sp. WF3-4]|uniref:hypothetical protein n=1 Tax=Gilliamella sp. WF3-4 TaxID=3120255 RepID=UPI00080ED2D6|nr:hypothetical protein [Gilliamella apicola]OCG16956.1 hypothetical protein A9G47_09900 [Gilliamella apicola]
MGKAKPVTINRHDFPKKEKAISYFLDRRPEVKEAGLITEGNFFEDLKDLYKRYCNCSPSWEFNGREIVAFIVGNERRNNNGDWFETVCYKVKFSNDEIRPFSIRKAVTAIINNEK